MVLQTPQRMTVSTAVARVVAKETPYADRLAAARGEFALGGRDLLTALYLLYGGGDREIRAASVRTLRSFPLESLVEAAALADLPPKILHFLAQVRGNDAVIFRVLLDHPACPLETLVFLFERADRPVFSLIFDREVRWRPFPEAVSALLNNPRLTADERSTLLPEEEPVLPVETTDVEVSAEEEEWDEVPLDVENFSKYQLALNMGVSEKIKMALTGDKEWRSILLKDSNKLVNTAVLKNPRITDGEVLAVAKNKTSSEELIRMILMNKDWMKLPVIRSALVSHPKTPVAAALRFMDTLSIKELKDLSKSKSVSQIVVTSARRALAEKAKKK